jgi:hypothetical protein
MRGSSELGLTNILQEGLENLTVHHGFLASRSQSNPTAERPLEASLGQKVPHRHHDEHPDQMPSMAAANAEAAQSLNRARKS